MAELCNITHDDETLDEYNETVTDDGDLSVETPGLAGTTARMELLIDDTNELRGVKNISLSTNQIRVRFYIDPNSLTFDEWGDRAHVCMVGLSEGPWILAGAQIRWWNEYQIQMWVSEDSGSLQVEYSLSNEEHYIEFLVVRATSDVADDGYVTTWIDGVEQGTVSNVDNYDIWSTVSNVNAGFRWFAGTGADGTFYLDELKANDDGSEIGPVAGLSIPIAMHHYRSLRT